MQDRWQDWFQPDEKLRWEGVPVTGRVHWLKNIFLSCFGTPFFLGGLGAASAGLGFLPVDGPVGFGGTLFLFAFSVPFLAVGAGLVFGPWIADRYKPRRTRYALTDRAGYVATNFWSRKMDVFPIRHGVRVEYEDNGGGAGSVFFHFEGYRDSDGDPQIRRHGFEDIADAKKVYDLVRKLKADAEPESTP